MQPFKLDYPLLLAALLIACLAPPSGAAGTLSDAAVGISWGYANARHPCTGSDVPLDPGCDICCDYVVGTEIPAAPAQGGFWVYIFVMDIDPEVGLSSITFALEFNDTPGQGASFDGGSFNCADQEFPGPGWPGTSRSTITLIWLEPNCQNTVDPNDPQDQAATVAYALYCYAYGEDRVSIVGDQDDILTLKDCSLNASSIWHPEGLSAGTLGLGHGGWNPCGNVSTPVPVENASWGELKKSYYTLPR